MVGKFHCEVLSFITGLEALHVSFGNYDVDKYVRLCVLHINLLIYSYILA